MEGTGERVAPPTLDELLALRRFGEASERLDAATDDAARSAGSGVGPGGASDDARRAGAFLAAVGAGGTEAAVVSAERSVADGDDLAPDLVPLAVRALQRHGRHVRAARLLDEALDQWPTREQLTVAAAQLHGLDPSDPLPLMSTRRGWEAEIVWRDQGGSAGERALLTLPAPDTEGPGPGRRDGLGEGRSEGGPPRLERLVAEHDWWLAQLIVASSRRAAGDHATAASLLEIVGEEWPAEDAAVELATRAAFDRCLAGHVHIAADSLAAIEARVRSMPGHRAAQVVVSAVLVRLPPDGPHLVDAARDGADAAALAAVPVRSGATAAAVVRARARAAGLPVVRVGIDAAVIEAALADGATVVVTASPWGAACPVRVSESRTGLVVIDRATSVAPFAGPLPVAVAELSGAGAELVIIGGAAAGRETWGRADVPDEVDRAELAVHRADVDPRVAAAAVAAGLDAAPRHPAVMRAEGALLVDDLGRGVIDAATALVRAREWVSRVSVVAGRPTWARAIEGDVAALAGRSADAVAAWSLGWPPPESAPELARRLAGAFDELGSPGPANRLRARADLLSSPPGPSEHPPTLVVVG